MKFKLISSCICVVLVVALLMGNIQPASAAFITYDVEPSGISFLRNYLATSEKLPDRTRYTFQIPQPEDNYYSLTYYRTVYDNYWSYDCNSGYVSLGGWGLTSAPSYRMYLYAYPAGRTFYRLPFAASLISSTDMRFEVTFQFKRVNYTSSGISGYSNSVSNSPVFQFCFYDANFRLISNVTYNGTCCASSGSASSDTFINYTYFSSVVIPSDAFYVVPCFYIYRDLPRYSTSPSSYYYEGLSSVGMSCSMRFDVMDTESLIDGVWQFNDTLSGSSNSFFTGSFSSGGVTYSGMDCYVSDTGSVTLWYNADSEEIAYLDGSWYIDTRKVVDFGSLGYSVSAEFYDFLTRNATRIGDSISDTIEGCIKVKDYSGSNVFEDYSTSFPVIVNVTETGLLFTSCLDPNVTWSYTYTGSGTFVGVSLVANASYTRYGIGTSFTMNSPGSIYLHLEGDIDSIDPTDPTDTTDPTAPTDPSTPGTSDPTDPANDPFEDEKNQAGVGGNDSFNDIVEVVPDYSADFIEGFKTLAAAISYEGTEAYLVTPPIVIPAIGGLFPEMEILPSQYLDFEIFFYAVPESWMTLIHALFDVAIVVYAGKELYDLIQETFVLKKASGE